MAPFVVGALGAEFVLVVATVASPGSIPAWSWIVVPALTGLLFAIGSGRD